MELSLLRTFLAVYRAGSVTGAASVLGLAQPTITGQLRALEAALDQQLFVRLPRGVAPTSVADELARQVAPHVDALAAISERGLAPTDPLAKPVHLAGPAELTSLHALPALAGLVRRGLRLRVTFGLADELLAGLAAGRFDLVISVIRPRGRAIGATALMDEDFVLVAAPEVNDRIDAGLLAVDPVAALRPIPLVAYAEELPIIRRYWRTVFDTRPTQHAAVVVPDLRSVLACVLAGAGLSVLPRYLCAAELAAGRLVAVLEPSLPPINTLFLATRNGTGALPHIATVHDHLLASAKSWG